MLSKITFHAKVRLNDFILFKRYINEHILCHSFVLRPPLLGSLSAKVRHTSSSPNTPICRLAKFAEDISNRDRAILRFKDFQYNGFDLEL